MFAILKPHTLDSKRAVALLAIAATTVTCATAATVKRFAVTQGTGSEGATAYANATATGGTLQANVGPIDTGVNIPFAIFGEYDAASGASGQFGIGVAGISTTGYGVAAEVLGTNPAMYALQKGSGIGMDLEMSGNGTGLLVDSENTGVLANVSAGDGVIGESTGPGYVGVFGEDTGNTAGYGVVGTSAFGTGGSFQSTSGYGIAAQSTRGYGAIISSQSSSAIDAYVGEPTSNGLAAIYASTAIAKGGRASMGLETGEGLIAFGASGTSNHPALVAYSTATGTDLFDAVQQSGSGANETASSTFTIQGTSQNRSGHVITTSAHGDVQVQGDVYLTGSLYSQCNGFPASSSTTCVVGSTGATSTIAGRQMETYTAHHASPTLEDEGETRLVNGIAHVALDPAFASTISRNVPYLVFLTPWGDTRGLYAANRTATGFDVHESGNGRSTLAFDYRILAKPLGDENRRMAPIAPASVRTGYAYPVPRSFARPARVAVPHAPNVHAPKRIDLMSAKARHLP